MTLVSLRELVAAAHQHGLHVSVARVHAAVRDGDIVPFKHRPLIFTQREANEWLNRVARLQRVRPSR